jgi:hypothetical protein
VAAVAQQGPALVEQGHVARAQAAYGLFRPQAFQFVQPGKVSRFGPNIYASMMRPAGAVRATTPTA